MKKALLFAVVLLVAGCGHQSDLPRLFPVPDASLTDQQGQAVRLAGNRGYVTVYDFIFTNCAGTCPMMSATMHRIAMKTDKDAKVRFVSISVDPRRDTPAVLAKYASHFGKDPRWTFLTGDAQTITHLSVDGFKLAAGSGSATPDESILHSTKFAIADKDGFIREYYGAINDDAVDHVAATIKDLVRE